MSHSGEGHGRSYERIQSMTTVQDILKVATEFERSARDFYRDLAPKVSKRIRYIVEELAVEEQEHLDLFENLAQRDDLQQTVKQRIQRPPSDSKFSDCIHLPDLGDNPDDQDVLQYAMHREHTAMLQYTSLAESAEPGPIQELFHFLAMEETEHKLELEKTYYEVVHSGGV